MNREPTLNEPGLQVCIVLSSELPGSSGKRKYKVSLKKPAFFPSRIFVHSFIQHVDFKIFKCLLYAKPCAQVLEIPRKMY